MTHHNFIEAVLIALTDPQVDQLIHIFELFLVAIREGIKTLWVALAPFLLGYLAIRQAMNRKALDENTKVSKDAFDAANSHNEKIAKVVEISETLAQVIPTVKPTNDPPKP